MGNLLTFVELLATALWLGGAATAGAGAARLRWLFYVCAAALVSVAACRGCLWLWTPLHSLSMGLALAAGLATRWLPRVPGIVFGVLYVAWIAWRGY
jgi:hypothetical protein